MKIQINYSNGDQTGKTTLESDECQTVKELKEEVSIEIDILPEYIVLKHKNILLNDDFCLYEYELTDDCSLMMQLKVELKPINNTSGIISDRQDFLMEYDSCVRDLKTLYCTSMKVTDVVLKYENICLEDEFLREYLCERNIIFTVFGLITICIVFEDGIYYEIKCYQNEYIKSIRHNLTQKGLLKNKKSILMIGDTVLWDGCELYKLVNFDPFVMYIGFTLHIKTEDERIYQLNVNFHTKISHLIMALSKKVSIEPNLISLMIEAEYLEINKTIGHYNLISGCTLNMVFNFEIVIMQENTMVTEYVARKNQTVRDIKESISTELSLDVNRITLLYNDREINDYFSLNFLEFESNRTISMVIHGDNLGLNDCINSNFDKAAIVSSDNDEHVLNMKFLQNISNVKTHNSYGLYNDIDFQNYSKTFDKSLLRNSIGDIGESIKTEDVISLFIIDFANENSRDNMHRIVTDKTSTVQYLRTVISQQLRIAMCGLDINFLGEPFIGGTLESNGIRDNYTLVLKDRKNRRDLNEQFILYVKNVAETNSNICSKIYLIDDFLTVVGLKNILRKEYNVNVNRMDLKIGTKTLNNDTVIRELDIENGSTILLHIGDDDGCNREITIRIQNSLEFGNDDRNHVLSVNVNDRVDSVRIRIKEMLHESSEDFVLSYRGEVLRNENALHAYGISDNDVIVASQSLLVKYFTTFNNYTSKVSRFAFVSGDTVSSLKLKIQSSLNIEPRFISLTYNGLNLEDEELLINYSIENNSCLMMISTLAGGMRSI